MGRSFLCARNRKLTSEGIAPMWYLTVLPTTRTPPIPDYYDLDLKRPEEVQKAQMTARRVWGTLEAKYSSCVVELGLVWKTSLEK